VFCAFIVLVSLDAFKVEDSLICMMVFAISSVYIFIVWVGYESKYYYSDIQQC